MQTSPWTSEVGQGPLVAAQFTPATPCEPRWPGLLKLDEAERLREEDPFTDRWTSIAPTRVVGGLSRFELDLNRPREKAVYLTPSDAWGLEVWKSPPPAEVVGRSLAIYDDFYALLRGILDPLVARHKRVVVFDLHSYNHRRQGPGGPVAEPIQNPEINLGTRTMDRSKWARVVDRAIAEFRHADYLDRRLDVRENVKFFGGNLAAWTHQNYPESVCVLAVEVKKIFMDEWTGALDEASFAAFGQVLAQAAAGVLDELENWDRAPLAT